ncbi:MULTISPECIES: hypothetical protein [Eikenella]|uniref:hypothetical protein n=1 Tax=Eikenella TaxID=538 RepID=UPI0007E261EF|nr:MULTISPECIES: hypothetical protein [Eikenella]OAM38391.1 hypothetical protein A7P99_04330 [Eikenella sp. NML120348]OAM44744.1 hypothetical protein A7Q03_08010 [Eikenella sp. NML99-0057]
MYILPFSMPVKPFKMRGIGPHRPIMMALVALLLLPVGAIFVAWQSHVATEIYQDYQIGQHAVPVNARIDGECTTRKSIFTSCNTTITYRGHTVKKSFSFFGTGGDIYTRALADANDPSRLTLDVAVEKVGNRSMGVLLFGGLGLLMIGAAFYVALVRVPRYRRILAAINRPEAQPWQLAAVPCLNTGNAGKDAVYQAEIDGKTRKIGLSFGKQENRAWTFQTPSGQHYLLAFVPNGGGVPVALDRKLVAVAGLSKGEKSKLAAELKRAAETATSEC